MKTKLILLCTALLISGDFGLIRAAVPAGDLSEVIAGNTEFAVDLYGQLRTRAGNACFSPYSLSAALAMTYGGARTTTAKQMAHTLHLQLPEDRLHPAFAALSEHLQALSSPDQVKLSVANSLWPQAGFPFLPDYLALCRDHYQASITPVDFRNASAACRTINDWVATRTNQKILDLMNPKMVGPSTRLVLVNAVYFHGRWASPFTVARTRDQPFHVTEEKSRTIPLMQQTGNFRHAQFPGWQLLELPYAGNDLSMVVLLPDKPGGLDRLESELSAPKLTSWLTNLTNEEVMVTLPKFKAASQFSLSDTLSVLGMSDAFNPARADFSGMDGRSDLFISAVVHQAFVEVNEAGTEAAAATAVIIRPTGIPMNPRPVPVFRADHPFLFLIRDNHTGSLLFMGRLVDPTP